MKGGGNRNRNYSEQLSTISGGHSVNNDDCSKITFETNLKKLQKKISTLNVGDVLQLNLDEEMQLINALSGGVLCGIVDAPQAIQLRNCMKKGHKYKATILELDITFCKVRIQTLISIL